MTSIEELEKKINFVVNDMKQRDAIVFENRKDIEETRRETHTFVPIMLWVCAVLLAIFVGVLIGSAECISHEKAYLAANNATMLAKFVAGGI